MISTIAEAHGLLTAEDMETALLQTEHDLNNALEPLRSQLQVNLLSGDPSDIYMHMGFVESWRDRVARHLVVIQAVYEHSKSDHFELKIDSKPTEFKRDQYRRRLSGGWAALQTGLENLIESIDSRVNICKKRLGVEGDALKTGNFPRNNQRSSYAS